MQKPFRVLLSVLSAVVTGAIGCANLNDPYGGGYGSPYGGGYNSPPSGYYGGPGYYGNGYDGRERRELERERERLEEERARLERERDRQNFQSVPSMARPTQDRCPAGFSPSENKCSPEERRRGCRDMRLPSGLGCVSR